MVYELCDLSLSLQCSVPLSPIIDMGVEDRDLPRGVGNGLGEAMDKFSKCRWLLHGSHPGLSILFKRWMCLGIRMCLDRRLKPSEQGGEFFIGGWPQQRDCIRRI